LVGRLSRFVGALILAVALATGIAASGAHAEEPTISIAKEDAAMNAAIAKARDGLPVFWAAMTDPEADTEGYSLKVAITDGDRIEHFWTSDIQRTDERITGVLANEPKVVSTVQQGQRIDVPEADISDWMYMRKGKIVGNETLRVLLNYMPENQAAEWRAMFEEP
jgi:uncharacterized protein YegJ (DUF2314 family)